MHFARRAFTGKERRITVTGTIDRIDRHKVVTLAAIRVIRGFHRLLSGGCGRHQFRVDFSADHLTIEPGQPASHCHIRPLPGVLGRFAT
jgi:hypothetical protein